MFYLLAANITLLNIHLKIMSSHNSASQPQSANDKRVILFQTIQVLRTFNSIIKQIPTNNAPFTLYICICVSVHTGLFFLHFEKSLVRSISPFKESILFRKSWIIKYLSHVNGRYSKQKTPSLA